MTPEDIKKIYTAENEKISSGKMITSPFGKYTLFISYFKTGSNTWNVSRGQVYESGIDRPPVYSKTLTRKPSLIETVHRNYGSFPFLFVEDHPNGHDYLICGENYMGQTVIELDTRRRIDYYDADYPFCWVEYDYHKEENLLIVNGCFWACPYEIKLFDFSDPMNGLSRIVPTNEEEVYLSEKPEINGGIFVFPEHKEIREWDEELDSENDPPKELAVKTTYRREGNSLVFVDEWCSEREIKDRAEQKEYARIHKEKMEKFYTSDPLYLLFAQEIQDSFFNTKSGYAQLGFSYPEYWNGFSTSEQTYGRRILNKIWSVDLSWCMETGPIKLIIYKNEKLFETKFFMEHSKESMKKAFSYVKKVCK